MKVPIPGLVVIALLTGCGASTPEAAFDRLAEAAESGDSEAFLAGCTTETRALLEGLDAFSARYPELLKSGPFSNRVRAVAAEIQSPSAIVLVSSDGGERGEVVFRDDHGRWLLDLIGTEMLWNRSWELSGGKPRRLMEMDGLGVEPALDNPRSLR